MSQLKVSKEAAKKYLTQRIARGMELIDQASELFDAHNKREARIAAAKSYSDTQLRRIITRSIDPRIPSNLFELKQAWVHWVDDITEDCGFIYSEPHTYESYFQNVRELPVIRWYAWLNARENQENFVAFIKLTEKYVARLVRMLDQLEVYSPSPAEVLTSNDVVLSIKEMHLDLGAKIEDIKKEQAIIYQCIGVETQAVLNSILKEFRQQSIGQNEMQNTLDAIRQALKYIEKTGLPVDDDVIKQTLADIYQAVNSDISLQQKLELSLPVIPFLLEYKIELGAGVDLGAVWKELVRHVEKIQGK